MNDMRGRIWVRNLIAAAWLALLFADSAAAADSLKWHSFEEGMAIGNSQGKKVYIHFWADWCRFCHTMEKETFRNPAIVKLLSERFITVKVDAEREKQVSNMFRVKGLPDNWFFSESGDIIGHRPGYIPPDTFLKILKTISNTPPTDTP
jgi:thioredoxin-related protein